MVRFFLFFSLKDVFDKICQIYYYCLVKNIIMDTFITKKLADLAKKMSACKEQFIEDFKGFCTDSRFSAENAEKIVEFLINPQNHKIGSTELLPGLKVNIDWATSKSEKDALLELHHKFYDVHIPTFNEGIFMLPVGIEPEVVEKFDDGRDIGFYKVPKCCEPELIEAGSWKFVPTGIYHGPMFGEFANPEDAFFVDESGKKFAVKIVLKIKAD